GGDLAAREVDERQPVLPAEPLGHLRLVAEPELDHRLPDLGARLRALLVLERLLDLALVHDPHLDEDLTEELLRGRHEPGKASGRGGDLYQKTTSDRTGGIARGRP